MSTEHGQQQQSGGRRSRGSGDKKSRRRSRRKETYSMYIYKVLKQVRRGASACACAGLGWLPDRMGAGTGLSPRTEASGLKQAVLGLGLGGPFPSRELSYSVTCRGHLKPAPHRSLESVRAFGRTR